MKLSAAQIAGHAKAAGWTGPALVTAVAVALGESGGRTDARGDVALQTGTWGPSIGLWQIRSLTAQRGTGGVRDEVANLNPATNARHAHRIWADAGGKFSPWTVYNTGAWLLHKAAATRAAGNPATVTAAAATSSASTPAGTTTAVAWSPLDLLGDGAGALALPGEMLGSVQALTTFAAKTYAWMTNRDNIDRVIAVAVGGGFLMGGAALLAWPALRATVSGASDMVLGGGAARVARKAQTAADNAAAFHTIRRQAGEAVRQRHEIGRQLVTGRPKIK